MKAIKNLSTMFADSAKELKDLRHLIIISMLIALTIIGEDYLRIPLAPGNLEIRFGFIFKASISFLFGPVAGFIAGIISDLLAYIIHPSGAFHIGFTINSALGGIIYGICLYKKNSKSPYFIIHILISKALVNFIINITLTPIWLYGLYGSAGKILTLSRISKNVIMLPIEILILLVVLKSLSNILKRVNLIKR